MKKLLFSLSTFAILSSTIAQTDSELAGNGPTETNNGYKYNFNTNSGNDNQSINCTDAGPIWDTFNTSGGVSDFSINSEGHLEISIAEITGAAADRYTRHSINRFYKGNCSTMTSSPVNLSGNKTVTSRVKSSVDVTIVILAATLDAGQIITNDATIDTIQLAAGADFRDVTSDLADTGFAGNGDISATLGWELFILGNVSAGTLTFDKMAFGDAKLVEDVIAKDDYAYTSKNSNTHIDVLDNDSGENLTTSILDSTSNGTVTLVQGDSIFYEPNTGFTGYDTLVYQICGDNNVCDEAKVFISVEAIEVIAFNDNVELQKNTNIVIDVQKNDSGENLTTTIMLNALDGEAEVINNDSIIYTPSNDFIGWDNIFYRVCNDFNQCDDGIIYITVKGAEVIAIRDSVAININENVVIDVQKNDSGDNLTTSIVQNAKRGNGLVSDNDSIVYLPNNNYSGIDSIVYSICNNMYECDQATLFINVNGINSASIIRNNYLKHYPNPSNNVLTLEFDAVDEVNIEITDVTGKVVKTARALQGPNKINLNVSDLNSGLYFISLRSNNGSITKKVIKQ